MLWKYTLPTTVSATTESRLRTRLLTPTQNILRFWFNQELCLCQHRFRQKTLPLDRKHWAHLLSLRHRYFSNLLRKHNKNSKALHWKCLHTLYSGKGSNLNLVILSDLSVRFTVKNSQLTKVIFIIFVRQRYLRIWNMAQAEHHKCWYTVCCQLSVPQTENMWYHCKRQTKRF